MVLTKNQLKQYLSQQGPIFKDHVFNRRWVEARAVAVSCYNELVAWMQANPNDRDIEKAEGLRLDLSPLPELGLIAHVDSITGFIVNQTGQMDPTELEKEVIALRDDLMRRYDEVVAGF